MNSASAGKFKPSKAFLTIFTRRKVSIGGKLALNSSFADRCPLDVEYPERTVMSPLSKVVLAGFGGRTFPDLLLVTDPEVGDGSMLETTEGGAFGARGYFCASFRWGPYLW